ncbi:MAG: FtsX-like permease family protein [Gammaproteobacteria bacterium]|nr:FtsX-like permease family protein [Gammaproteobacteria bacterium]
MSSLYLVFKNLTRSKLRLFLTLFATFIAFMVYGTLTAFQMALNAGVELSADDRLIVVNKIHFTQSLPISHFNKVKSVEGVDAVTHLNWFGGYYQDPQKLFTMMAVDPESFLDVYDDYVLTPAEAEAWLKNRQGLIAGESVARTFGWKVGDRIPINSNIFSQRDGSTVWDFDVVAIYRGKDEQSDSNSVYFHYKYFNETQSFGGNFIGWMGVRTTSPDKNEQVVNAIDDLFANTPAETDTMPEVAFNKAFIEQIGNIGLILTSVVVAAFFIILVIVGNSMVLSIRERTNEIGVMKTLGFTSPAIFRMVLAESVAIAMIGGLLGLLAARGLIHLISNAPIQLPPLIMDGTSVFKAILIMLALGLITGIVPAVNALRLNIVTALSRS